MQALDLHLPKAKHYPFEAALPGFTFDSVSKIPGFNVIWVTCDIWIRVAWPMIKLCALLKRARVKIFKRYVFDMHVIDHLELPDLPLDLIRRTFLEDLQALS